MTLFDRLALAPPIASGPRASRPASVAAHFRAVWAAKLALSSVAIVAFGFPAASAKADVPACNVTLSPGADVTKYVSARNAQTDSPRYSVVCLSSGHYPVATPAGATSPPEIQVPSGVLVRPANGRTSATTNARFVPTGDPPGQVVYHVNGGDVGNLYVESPSINVSFSSGSTMTAATAACSITLSSGADIEFYTTATQAGLPKYPVVCLSTGYYGVTNGGGTGSVTGDAVINVPSGVTVQPVDSNTNAVTNGRFDPTGSPPGQVLYHLGSGLFGYIYLDTSVVYFNNSSPFNATTTARSSTAPGPKYRAISSADMGSAWTTWRDAISSGNAPLKAADGGTGATSANDRRIHQAGPSSPFTTVVATHNCPSGPNCWTNDPPNNGSLYVVNSNSHAQDSGGDLNASFVQPFLSDPNDFERPGTAITCWHVSQDGTATLPEKAQASGGGACDREYLDYANNSSQYDGVDGGAYINRASNLSLLSTVVRGVEAKRGINHPLGLNLGSNSGTYVYPATKGSDSGGTSITYGDLFRLDPNWQYPAGLNGGTGPSIFQIHVVDAFKKYGAYYDDQNCGGCTGEVEFSQNGASDVPALLEGDTAGYEYATGQPTLASQDPGQMVGQFNALQIKPTDLQLVCTSAMQTLASNLRGGC